MPIRVGIQDLEASALLANAVVSGLEGWRDAGRLDPLSLEIVENLNRMTKGIGATLAWTKLRHSDATKLERADAMRTEPFEVTITKTGNIRTVDPIRPAGKESLFQNVPESARLDIASYKQVRQDIQRTSAELRIDTPELAKDGTHLFRHLHASWMKQQGRTLEEIQTFFDHQEVAVTRNYVHGNLDFGV